MSCQICNNKAYRRSLCSLCYKNDRRNKFHCTHRNCLSQVFALTLCQLHYKMWKRRCLFCSNQIFCKNVCRYHYRQYLKGDLMIIQPKCTKCDKTMYLEGLCLKHFKEKYTSCMIVGCNNKTHKKGLCCSHYFKLRRRKLSIN